MNKYVNMNKRMWLIPILVVVINALLIIVRWSSLPELLPAHFDLQGNASGVMSRQVLPLYPLIAIVISLIAYVIAHIKHNLQTGLVVLVTGICLVLLFSTLVTLTSGKVPLFMLAEPIILLVAVIGFVVCIVKSRKMRKF